ncbi:DUF6542 domain-containing protein [Streptomyces sp. NPDC059166]|uniref:DUF6542 domain-containing protein n=1 Tax=Streptomyces sp. NPDC059166 TaxID=3346752 RepID=UPI0036BCF81A
MEQHRTRTPQRRQAAQVRPAPSGGPGEAPAAASGPAVSVAVAPAPAPGGGAVPGSRQSSTPPVVLALRRFPNPRLTGIGAGLFAALTMFLLACVDRLLSGGSAIVYGVLFLPVSALTALWVRPADLVTAPIIVPIAFAVGVIPVAGGTGGFGGQAMAVVTALAVHAGWLYGGTLVAGLIASVRKVRQMRERQRHLARTATGRPRV